MKKLNQKYSLDLISNHENALNFILDEYFKAGFGSLNKTDIDLIFFSALEQYGGLKDKSDYQISKKLGITQQRVRGLKERSYLKFSDDNKSVYTEKVVWEKLKDKLNQVTYDNKTEMITIPINDVNLFMELEHIVEERLHSVVGIQLNPKIFRISINDFFLLALMANDIVFNDKKDKKKVFTKIASQMKKHEDFKKVINNDFDIRKLSRTVFKSIGAGLLIDFIKDITPGSNVALSVIKQFCNYNLNNN